MRLVCCITDRIVKDVVGQVFMRVEVLIDGINLGNERATLFVGISHCPKAIPE